MPFNNLVSRLRRRNTLAQGSAGLVAPTAPSALPPGAMGGQPYQMATPQPSIQQADRRVIASSLMADYDADNDQRISRRYKTAAEQAAGAGILGSGMASQNARDITDDETRARLSFGTRLAADTAGAHIDDNFRRADYLNRRDTGAQQGAISDARAGAAQAGASSSELLRRFLLAKRGGGVRPPVPGTVMTPGRPTPPPLATPNAPPDPTRYGIPQRPTMPGGLARRRLPYGVR